VRTALFVPGNQPDRVDKAVATAADRVIIDMEDSVALNQKKEVRPLVREKIATHHQRRIVVRVNAFDTELIFDDLKAVVVEGLGGIVFPKIESAENAEAVNRMLADAESDAGMQKNNLPGILLIESAKAVQNIYQIVKAAANCHREFLVAFGAADYALSMGFELTKDGTELIYPRSCIAVACSTAGIRPPIDTPFMIDLKDIEALQADALRAKQLGFQGKLCIHPNQITSCNSIFTPSEKEISFARRVVKIFKESKADGIAAIQVAGKFVDYPVVERCRRIISLANKIGK
jgi:citrate lyase subunit beta/citryl-CoA lyase